jgi:hypothetical protein
MDIRIMREPTELEKQQYARLGEILALGRQRYLDAGGNPRRCPSGLNGDDYLTDEERQEALMLGRKVFWRLRQGWFRLLPRAIVEVT